MFAHRVQLCLALCHPPRNAEKEPTCFPHCEQMCPIMQISLGTTFRRRASMQRDAGSRMECGLHADRELRAQSMPVPTNDSDQWPLRLPTGMAVMEADWEDAPSVSNCGIDEKSWAPLS